MKQVGTKVITDVVRLSFVHLFEPYAAEAGQEPKYSVTVLIDKQDKEMYKAMQRAINEAKELGKSKWKGRIPNDLDVSLRDGDEKLDDDGNPFDGFAGHWYVNAKCKNKPGIIDAFKQEITDSTKVYSGCYARVSVNFYGYNVSGNRGIACGLNNVQFVKDGEPLGGRSRAEDDFDEYVDEDDDYEDML